MNEQAMTTTRGDLAAEDRTVMRELRRITSKGNDAEVRKKKDGTLAVYEVKKRAISV